MLDVLYLVHDLADPAVRRRVLTLQAGRASVSLAGFRRDANPLAAIDGIQPIEIGQTADAQFKQRMIAVAKACLSLRDLLKSVRRPDVIIARNLEMLAVANRARTIYDSDVPIAYECLDIHRLLLRDDAAGKAIRAAESYLGRNASLLLTSSPAFVDQYFNVRSGLRLPVMLLENKVIDLTGDSVSMRPVSRVARGGQPWKIGWFGALRCRKSLELLAALSRKMEGRFEIVLRGRPAYSEFEDFDGFVRAEPFMHFHGPYKNPEDLASIYHDVQFSWAIDFFEEGQNSSWLLPNRLYESGLHGAVPIAMRGTETARFLENRSIGMVVDNVEIETIARQLGAMTQSDYLDRFSAITAVNRKQWITDRADSAAIVERLATLASPKRPMALGTSPSLTASQER